MLSASGIIAILGKPEVQKVKAGYYFNCVAVSADPNVPEKLHQYTTDIFVTEQEYEVAVEKLVPKTVLQLRHGYWSVEKVFSQKFGKEITINKLKTNWKWMTPIALGKKQ